ncbi:putative reverse transcriptase domain-containing protein [Tanacetum coccineum]
MVDMDQQYEGNCCHQMCTRCSYKKFRRQAHNFNGNEGVVGVNGLVRKRWQMCLRICKCAEDDKVMFVYALFGVMLTWWNRNDGARGSLDFVFERKLTSMNTTIDFHENGFDVSRAKALRIGDSNKRKWEDQQGNNHHQQQNQRQEAAKVYVAAPTYGIEAMLGNLPWCNIWCKAHLLQGTLFPPRCGKCHKLGHQEGECQTRIPVARDNSLQNVTCFGCGNHGHYRSDCPELKNQN